MSPGSSKTLWESFQVFLLWTLVLGTGMVLYLDQGFHHLLSFPAFSQLIGGTKGHCLVLPGGCRHVLRDVVVVFLWLCEHDYTSAWACWPMLCSASAACSGWPWWPGGPLTQVAEVLRGGHGCGVPWALVLQKGLCRKRLGGIAEFLRSHTLPTGQAQAPGRSTGIF